MGSASLGDVSATVLDPDNVWMFGQPGHQVHRDVNVGVGRNAVEHDGDGTGVRHGQEVLLEGRRAHLVLEVARGDHHRGVYRQHSFFVLVHRGEKSG